jgi:hypothetical protein
MPDTPTTDPVKAPMPLSIPAEPSPGARLHPALGVWLRDLIVSLAISAFIIVFIYQPVKVEGTSMMPSLEDQERIFVNKFAGRYCRVPLSARSLKELYQARGRSRR